MRHINALLNPDIMVGEEEEEEEGEEENQSEEEDQQQIHGHLQLQQHRFQKQQFNGRLDRDAINTHQTRPLKKRPFFLSSPSTSSKQSIDYSSFGKTIMEYTHHLQPPSRSGLKNAGGKIIEVQGGHVVRSSGTKDRHSKICTAKGARDRRVRLSAHTAIQFYDVQDRLGYDRPSKAVDWLIKKAKSAIDQLAELPPWNPTATTPDEIVGSKWPIVSVSEAHLRKNPSNDCNFLPLSFESDAIADTIKSFFPMAGSATTSSSTPFQNYPPDLLSRTSSQNQDLRLSLQSFQNPNLPHQQPPISNSPTTSMEQALFSISALQPFDASVNSSGKQQPSPEMGQFQKMISWDSGIETENRGFVFHSQNQLFSQREPLQSSNSPSVRALTDPNSAAGDLHYTPLVNPSSISGIGFASGEFSGFNFHIPARIQGEEQSSFSNESSSDSRH